MNNNFDIIKDSTNTNIFNNIEVITNNNLIVETLSKYSAVNIQDDKSIIYKTIKTTYFLEENKWEISFFNKIPQFEEITSNLKGSSYFEFSINSLKINNELKFIVYNKIFSESWNLKAVISVHKSRIRYVCSFINEKYPNINSLNELDINKSHIEWLDWLNKKNINTKTKNKYISGSSIKETTVVNSTGNYFKNLINSFNTLTDTRVEWEKDKWNVKNLEMYGIKFSPSDSSHSIDFSKIDNTELRISCKKYFKSKLISSNNLTWGTAHQYMTYIPVFLNYICKLEPTWNNLNELQRKHIEKYIEWLHIHANEKSNLKKSNPSKYVNQVLIIIESFLLDIQSKELDMAPNKNIKNLIRPEDKPKTPKKSSSSIEHVPNYVLDQLFEHINKLPEKIIPIVYVMFKTGLRISDTLELKQDCLIKLDNKYWIETYIRKVDLENHRIPIDNELADLLSVIIDESKKNSNSYNNPKKYIFVNYSGANKGSTYSRKWVYVQLNELALKYNITDESGNIFHFKNHAFRHNYAITLLNNGVDIVTVQDLLAHASPEMTMRYAKLLDSTKREVFDNVVKKGLFKFDESDKLKEENNGELPDNVIDMLYTNHKLHAVSTPYGSCIQRKSGNCTYAKRPPCLTVNGGSPCKNLCIGATDGDIKKYEILIESTEFIINNAKIYNREEMVNDNQELLNLLKGIHSTIVSGGIIYGNSDRLNK